MARRPLTKPRKAASQERSRATVDALVEATARILVREGFDKASTNRIAEVAGVSVGSLYQYFPGKEALVAAVIERHQQEIMQRSGASWRRPGAADGEGGAQAGRRGGQGAPHRSQAAPRARGADSARGQAREAGDLQSRELYAVQDYLESHRDELRVDDLELAAFVCVTSIEALTHNAVLHHPEMLSDEAMEALIDEAARLVVGYLKG